MKLGVVIAAAGHGKRMGTVQKKQFIELQGKPVLYHSVSLFAKMAEFEEIVVVTPIEDISRTQKLLEEFDKVRVIPGGEERQQSVFCGLQALQDVDYVLIHDAARPFVTKSLIHKLISKVVETGAVVPAVPVKDTIKLVDKKREVISTPPRQSLWAVQTPQAFRLSAILHAHRCADREQFLGTDDAMLLESQGQVVSVIEGEYTNIKLTTPEDLWMGQIIMEGRHE